MTISGTGFASTGNEVSIGGSECIISTESSTEIVCVTEAHDGSGKFPVQVKVPGNGIASTNDLYFYVDRWSSIYTWGGGPVPKEGDLVVIEEGQDVLIDKSTEILTMLLIKGGNVHFDREATEELFLRSHYILIVGGGSLNIGSEEEPFMNEATIELHGHVSTIELPVYGAKVLAVREGTLDVHGKPIPTTWTHLSETANSGDTEIKLKKSVTWVAGDKIVIATTEKRFSKNENEIRTIDSVSNDGKTITLSEALEYDHISISQTFGGREIETRAEVGILSRNVRIKGTISENDLETIPACDEKWNPNQFATMSCFNGKFGEETGSQQFGATVMLMGKFPNQDLVQGRVSYTEVTEAGQVSISLFYL